LRILLSGMPNMLVSVITGALAQFPDMIVAGRADAGDDLTSKVRSTHADVVMMQSDDPGRVVEFEPLLRDHPVLKVVAIAADGTSGFLHELRPYSLALPELSAEVLRTVLRSGSLPTQP
jgi:DNA-binding NarL/FixJ family response regulator